MSRIRSGEAFGRELCRVLGLDPDTVRSVTVHAEVCQFTTATVEHIVTETGESFTKSYEIREVEA